MTPLEIVSDLGGSVRLPAHFCGVYGLKTSEHRVPLSGFFKLPPGAPRSLRILSSLGPLARSLDDLELALALVAGPDGIDHDVPPVPLTAAPRVRIDELRVAYAAAPPGAVIARSLQREVERVAQALGAAGAHVEARLPEGDWQAANALFGELVGALTSEHLDLDLRFYFDALERRDALMTTWERFFRDFDCVLLPPAMTTAFPHRAPGGPLTVDGARADYFGQGAPLAMANLAGLPALVAPASEDEDGLPIGVQLMGPRWSESRLCAIVRALEAARVLPGFRSPPA